MEIFDAHVHIESGFEAYDLPVSGRNLICNDFRQWEAYQQVQQAGDSLTLIFEYQHHLSEIIGAIAAGQVDALKIHSRIQKIRHGDYSKLMEQLESVPSHIPIILDAFYYGPEWDYQPNLEAFTKMILRFPDRRFLIAHSGGHKVLSYFFQLKPCENVFFDLSMSLAYLVDTSAFQDLVKLIKHIPAERILFGSDFPNASPKQQVTILRQIFDTLSLSGATQNRILYLNGQGLFFNGC